MTSITPRLVRDRRPSSVLAAAVLALVLAILRPAPEALAQGAAGDRWVGTWATAEVGRPQNPVSPAPGPAPFMANSRCPAPPAPPVPPSPGQPFAPPPYVQFTNQTLRQIVHTSIGGDRKEHTSELQSPCNLVCRLLLEKKKTKLYDINRDEKAKMKRHVSKQQNKQ